MAVADAATLKTGGYRNATLPRTDPPTDAATLKTGGYRNRSTDA